MTDVSTCDVTELDLKECESVGGGSDWSYAVGYTAGLMAAHPLIALANAITYYVG